MDDERYKQSIERFELTRKAIRIRQSGVPDAENAALAILKPLFEGLALKIQALRTRLVANVANDA